MATLTLLGIQNLVRSALNEPSTSSGIVTSTELTAAINDGYKDVAAKALCYEAIVTKDNIPASVKLVSLIGSNVVRVNYAEYYISSASGGRGVMNQLPNIFGHRTPDDYTPHWWFQWGDFLIVDPSPDVATYDLNLYCSCYPAAVLTNPTDIPSSLPSEFLEDIIQFATSRIAFKLKRWNDAAMAYNRYIVSVQRKRYEYVAKNMDHYQLTKIPGSVTTEQAAR